MNKEKLARTTFVILRETHEQLNYISERMSVSRSELVRDLMAEPVAFMAKWVRSLPDNPTAAHFGDAGKTLQQDMIDLLVTKGPEFGLEVTRG